MALALHPSVIVAWRGPGRVQIGLDPDLGVILADLDAGDERVLDALRLGRYTAAGLTRFAQRMGIGRDRAQALIEELRGRGILVECSPAPGVPRRLTAVAHAVGLRYRCSGWEVVARRLADSVLLVGAGAVGPRLVARLLAAGIGTVLVYDPDPVTVADTGIDGFPPTTLGSPRHEVLAGLFSGCRVAEPEDPDPAVAVLVSDTAISATQVDGFLRGDIDHLPLLLREQDVVVGPLVHPGSTCCLRCVELYRTDRDPDWATIRGQVQARRSPAHDPLLLDLAATVVVAQVLLAVDGVLRPTCWGATLELRLDDPVPTVRNWPAHPRCGCTWPPPRPRGTMAR